MYLVTTVTMGPVGRMKSTRKQKLFAIIRFGGGGGGVVCLNIVSSPGPSFVKVKVRFCQVGEKVGQGFLWPSL